MKINFHQMDLSVMIKSCIEIHFKMNGNFEGMRLK